VDPGDDLGSVPAGQTARPAPAPAAAVPDEGVRLGADGVRRCWWCGDDPLYVAYHDDEWGRPVTDTPGVFEKLSLEAFQSGLSWLTILRKRPAFRAAFAGFDPHVVAGFDDDDVARLLGDAGIVRNRAKIVAAVVNARATVALERRGDSLAELVWRHRPAAEPPPRAPQDLRTRTPSSTALATALKRAGFAFVGPTTMHALQQALGLRNDHLDGCDLRAACASMQAGP
jgi:DNA-3-methyladenine glycosylase I